MVMISEVPHLSQDFLDFRKPSSIISFRRLVSPNSTFRLMWGSIPGMWGNRKRLPSSCVNVPRKPAAMTGTTAAPVFPSSVLRAPSSHQSPVLGPPLPEER